MLLQWSGTKTSAGWATENAAIDAPFNYLPSASELQPRCLCLPALIIVRQQVETLFLQHAFQVVLEPTNN